MNAIRIKRHIDSETLTLPEISALIGKDVEIIFLEDEKSPTAKPIKGKFSDSAGMFPDIDEDAILQLREISKI